MLVEGNGNIFWSNGPKLLTFFCEFDPGMFPYDEQTCSMRFTSFKYQRPRMIFELGTYTTSESFFANSGNNNFIFVPPLLSVDLFKCVCLFRMGVRKYILSRARGIFLRLDHEFVLYIDYKAISYVLRACCGRSVHSGHAYFDSFILDTRS